MDPRHIPFTIESCFDFFWVSTSVTVIHSHHHHHWTHISRPLPSRKPCSARVSSSAPAFKEAPSSSAIPFSSATPSSVSVITSPPKASSAPYVRPFPSHSLVPHPHWSHISRPLPHRSSCSPSSSGAIPTSSSLVSIPVPKASTTHVGLSSSGVPQSSGLSATEQRSSQASISEASSAPTTTIVVPVSTFTPSVSQSGSSLGAVTVSGSSTLQLTTSTVLSTRTATITACPSTVVNCPASSKSTFVTTETIVVSTTICPVTEGSSATQTVPSSPSVTGNSGDSCSGNNVPGFTTSTVYSIRTATITACPSLVAHCPLRSKTTYLTTETLVVSTTVCPVADATATADTVATQAMTSPSAIQVPGSNGNGGSQLTTSTIYATRTATILACPESVTNCPLRSQTTSATVQTVAVATTVYPVSPVYTTLPVEGADAVAPTVTVANAQATETGTSVQDTTAGSEYGYTGPTKSEPTSSRSGESSNAGATYTTTLAVESCSDDGTCTGYVNTIVMTQTGIAQPTGTPGLYVQHFGAGASSNRTASASSTHAWVQSTYPSGMTTAAVFTSSSAVNAVYTGAASAATQFPMIQVFASLIVTLVAMLG
ncbi:hypothetical protein PENARI_c015G01165 [Penicillium arizonense]|uniref:Uncharacterized protein n=1 Tax=Penicillium arizonense TaxID=1835702 RepID=A0A1F5LCW4_PENAI|nr:hypothetical protein PENARI_c015G01165 [Penicillium arizonense]OGE50781.1 hypothetical protein PENARI_c015G01165 [Penicillium arizonense]